MECFVAPPSYKREGPRWVTTNDPKSVDAGNRLAAKLLDEARPLRGPKRRRSLWTVLKADALSSREAKLVFFLSSSLFLVFSTADWPAPYARCRCNAFEFAFALAFACVLGVQEHMMPSGAVWVGHAPPDSDSVMSAIAAAFLFKGGRFCFARSCSRLF